MQKQGLFKVLVLVLSLFVLFACSRASKPATAANAQAAPAVEAKEESPPGPGEVGVAVTMTGNVTRGAQVFKTSCMSCHGAGGDGKVANPGSEDGTVPPLNPIDPEIAGPDIKAFTKNIDIYIEHGSTPEGSKPTLKMPAFGDEKKLTPQQIADVIAYTISIGRR